MDFHRESRNSGTPSVSGDTPREHTIAPQDNHGGHGDLQTGAHEGEVLAVPFGAAFSATSDVVVVLNEQDCMMASHS
ncbi:hypothetical protein AB1N83_004169 [Pleurotus pulmonarius]